MSNLAVVLAERFGSKPVRPSLLELVDQLVEASMSGLQADEGSNTEEVLALKCSELRSEIQRRIDELENFHGTEATRMRAILETGEDKAWWQA